MWEKSFYYLDSANQYLHKKFPFNEAKKEGNHKLIKELYNHTKDLDLPIKYDGYKLIFIVGLPRCGSTMVENVISMNKHVYSMGEAALVNKLLVRKNPGSGAGT